jgi:hypothetical protein
VTDVEDADAICRAVTAYGRGLQPEARWDLRQELSTLLAARLARPDPVYGWAVAVTRNILARRRRILVQENAYLSGGPPRAVSRRHASRENWEPSWYPPHPDATQYAPFAMPEARSMNIRPSASRRNAEDVFIALIDANRRHVR